VTFKLTLSLFVLGIVVLVPAQTAEGRGGPDPFYVQVTLAHGSCEFQRITMPVCYQLPWEILLKHEVELTKIKTLRDRCIQKMLPIYDVPDPVRRIKQLRDFDLKYRAELVALVKDEKTKRRIKELFGSIDKFRAYMAAQREKFKAQSLKLGLTRPVFLYADANPRKAVDLGKEIVLLAGTR